MTLIGIAAREIATVNLSQIANPRLPSLINETFGGWAQTNQTNPQWTSALYSTIMVYFDQLGGLAFIILVLIPFAMMLISHGNMKMTGITGLILSALVFIYLPATYQIAAVIMFVIMFATLLWGLFKQ